MSQSNKQSVAKVRVRHSRHPTGYVNKDFCVDLNPSLAEAVETETQGCDAIVNYCKNVGAGDGYSYSLMQVQILVEREAVEKGKVLQKEIHRKLLDLGVEVREMAIPSLRVKSTSVDEDYGSQKHDGYSWSDYGIPGGSGGRFY